MNRLPPLLVVFVFLVGCGKQHADNVSPDDARQALQKALEAWKEGKSNDELANLQPSIIMNEAEWSPGNRLLDFKLADAGALDGRQMRWVVDLELQDKNGKVSEKKATYIVDTIPRVVIVRDMFAGR